MACLTSMIEPLRAANEISASTAFSWELVAEQNGRVSSSADVKFDPARRLDEIKSADFIILLSPPNAQFSSKRSAGAIRAMSRHGTRIGAVSGGVFPLVRSGVVEDDVVSVHWCYEAAFRNLFPKTNASDQLVEIGPRLVTASGAAAAFDIALHLIETELGTQVATEVACWFQHPMMRRSGVSQSIPSIGEKLTSNELPRLVQEALEIYTANLSDPMQISEIADELGVSARHVERSFKKATGMNPTKYFRQLRMKSARQIVLYSNDRINQIAAAVGYRSASLFRQHYEDSFGMTPDEDRKRINLYRTEGNLPVPSV